MKFNFNFFLKRNLNIINNNKINNRFDQNIHDITSGFNEYKYSEDHNE